ncbi:uncharacterized protein A4U43_C06F19300 [Asparagus officinalis]|uniref:F-box domain-containing protein n=1 Tax=Asparagus officinalis TaxID=4686 RepID=A0A5P1ENW8_ASPOF|nr:F-box protein At3g07870-like [Asparagus officinalis]XP_020268710.1 F-box protein At3g07870-like [Asparagus officinalis]XP_020268711.1 F-box protein At3g07870-like [Asparagus officinalis]ONK67353.1 uncharacterized protein A4U43_C06F19300 [Asparagus officinalis]
MDFGLQPCDSKDDLTMRKPVTLEDPSKATTESFINKLPPEILAYILCRFPAVRLQRLRCVCKLWDLIIHERSFIEQHFNSRANMKDPGIITLSCKTGFSLEFYAEGSNFRVLREIVMSEHMKETYYHMTNSCHGMICVFGLISINVINPSINKPRALPDSGLHIQRYKIIDDCPLVGIGFDSSTRTYKVVRIFRCSSSKTNSNKMSMRCEVYTLGGGGGGCSSWKYVGEAPISPDAFNSMGNFPVVVNDAVHWIIRTEGHPTIPATKIALSFNVQDETFSLIPPPEGRSISGVVSSLVELEGCLSVCDTRLSPEQMDIWMLKDYNNHEWVKQYTIDLRMMHSLLVSRGGRTRLLAVRDGMMLFYNVNGRMDYYDPESKNFVKHERLVPCGFCFAPFVGSLIWPEL